MTLNVLTETGRHYTKLKAIAFKMCISSLLVLAISPVLHAMLSVLKNKILQGQGETGKRLALYKDVDLSEQDEQSKGWGKGATQRIRKSDLRKREE